MKTQCLPHSRYTVSMCLRKERKKKVKKKTKERREGGKEGRTTGGRNFKRY